MMTPITLQKDKITAIAIGGGGSQGSFGAGIINALNKSYDYYLGTSTGALLACMAAANKNKEMKEAYTNLNIKKIYSNNPYNKKGKLSIINGLKRLITKKNSLGSTDNLLLYIREQFTEKDFDRVKRRGIEIIVSVTNFNTKRLEYKSNKDYNYLEFTHWVWVSTLAYPFAEMYDIFADGGYSCPVPVYKACQLADEIDCIIFQQQTPGQFKKPKNPFQGLGTTIGVLLRVILNEQLEKVENLKREKDFKINYYYTPYKLTSNSMYFNKKQMEEWYTLGYNQIQKEI